MVAPCVGIDGPCRETLRLMPDGTAPAMYALFLLSVAVFAAGFWAKIGAYRRGGREAAWDHPGERLRNLVRIGLLQAKTARKKYAGPMHQMIYWGFAVLFAGTILVAIDYDVTLLFFDFQFLVGSFYLLFEFVLDAFGLLFLIGLFMAVWRRASMRPEALQTKRQDYWILGSLLLMGVQGFLLEGMRLAIRNPPWAGFSFAGNALAALFRPVSLDALLSAYAVLWWFHALTVFAWIAAIPFSKMQHIFTAPANIFFSTPEAKMHRGELSKPFDLAKALETGNLDVRMGAQRLEDFTWRQILSLDACTECGRCQEVCPAYAAGRPLSPMKVVLDLRAELHRKVGGNGTSPPSEAATAGNALVEAVIREQTLWSCVTCRACMQACPVMIEHVPLIVEMRRGLVMESRIDAQKTRLLTNLANSGNAYGFPAADRDAWAEGLEVPRLSEIADPSGIEVLYWVGCSGSYDSRNQKVSRALVKVLKAADVRFAILGREERCTGDPARRLGEEGRFQEIVLQNVETLRKYGIRRVVAQCPHCFNTLRNEYRRFGLELEVEHHTQFVDRLIRGGRLKLARPLADLPTTFHDPCYLGRYNREYRAPRQVLIQIQKEPPREMRRNRDDSFCCGAGGANMWFEVKEERERMSQIRLAEAKATGARRLATACPFCMTMFDDAARVVGDESFEVKDMVELVADRLEPTG